MLSVRLLCIAFGVWLAAQTGLAQSFPQSSAGNKSWNDPAFRVKTNIVNLSVSVLDRKGIAIPALEAHQFEVYEDGIKQQVEYFKTGDDPLSVGIILDASGSMNMQLAQAQSWLKAFVQNAHTEDEFFLIGIQDQPRLLKDFTTSEALLRGLPGLEAEGNTALFDGIAMGLEKLRQGRHARRALLVLSDGQDNQSRFGYRKLLQQVKETDAQIFSIGHAQSSSTSCGRICQLQARANMDDLTAVTGGESFLILTRDQLEQTLSNVAVRLRQQYSLAYTPTNEDSSQKWRKIDIKVQDVDPKTKYVIRTRKGYFPAGF